MALDFPLFAPCRLITETWYCPPIPSGNLQARRGAFNHKAESTLRSIHVPVDTSSRRIWDAALGRLELQVTRPSFETWLRGTSGVAIEGETLVVAVPSAFAAAWLEERLRTLVESAVRAVHDGLTTVAFQVHSEHARVNSPVSAQSVATQPAVSATTPSSFRFNPRYSFDAFVVGGYNQLAYAASRAVADAPGASYNPLFLYGAVGTGKTHLLHAIGAQATAGGRNVAYVTCEQFTNEFLTAIRERSTEAFRNRYRNLDLLLLDDIQFLVGKDGTQEALFHTFNALHDAGRQIVLTGDRHPAALPLLEERLRSRFEWGLLADIGTPDLETRIAMARAFAAQAALPVPDDVILFIAERAPANGRALQGCINKVTAVAHFTNVPVTLELTKANLGPSIAQDSSDETTPKTAIAAVAAHFGLPQAALISGRRDRAASTARQLAMYVLDRQFHLPPEEIGSVLGNRDRTTVIYNVKKIVNRLSTDDDFANEIATLLATFDPQRE